MMVSMLPFLLLILGLSPVAQARCKSRPATTEQLRTALDKAKAAARKLDDATFEQSSGVAERLLPCLDEPITPELASDFHLVGALSAFYDGDLRTSRLYFAAARSWTFYELDETLLPTGTRLRAVHDGPSPPTRFVRFPQPVLGSLTIDGVKRPDRPDARPLVSQYLSELGEVQQTDLVDAGAPLPALDLAPAVSAETSSVVAEAEPEPERRKRRAYKGPNATMLLVAGAAAAGAGVLYYLSLEERQTYDDAATDWQDLEQARLDHNRMLLGAWAAGGTAATLGVGAFVVGAF